jgi:hypothetical protein
LSWGGLTTRPIALTTIEGDRDMAGIAMHGRERDDPVIAAASIETTCGGEARPARAGSRDSDG